MERQFETYSPLATETDYDKLDSFYETIKYNVAVSTCAELIDTHTHTLSKDANRIKRFILNRSIVPFVFISCLN